MIGGRFNKVLIFQWLCGNILINDTSNERSYFSLSRDICLILYLRKIWGN